MIVPALFPKPLPGELDLSHLERACLYTDRNRVELIHHAVRGTDAKAGVKVYSRWGAQVVPVLAECCGMSLQDYIRSHTMLPHVRAFESEGLCAPHSRKHLGQLRLENSSTAAHPRFCPSCAKEQIDKFGFSYWRRIHQVAGILWCPDHDIPLWEADAPLTTASPCDVKTRKLDLDDGGHRTPIYRSYLTGVHAILARPQPLSLTASVGRLKSLLHSERLTHRVNSHQECLVELRSRAPSKWFERTLRHPKMQFPLALHKTQSSVLPVSVVLIASLFFDEENMIPFLVGEFGTLQALLGARRF